MSNHTHYSPTDPDARISVKPGKPRQLNYSAQTVVDTSHHVITNIQADYSDKRDSQSLAAVVEQTKKNLKPHGLEIEELLADTGYSSGTALAYLEEQNITVYNALGQLVKQVKNISGQSVTLFRDNLKNGLYFIQLTQDNRVITTENLVITD